MPILLFAACGDSRQPAGTVGDDPAVSKANIAGPADLAAVPTPDLSGAEPAVQEQIATQLAALEAAPAEDPEARAEAFGDLGLLYLIYDFLDASEASFDNARRLRPEDYRWQYLLGYLQVIQGRLAEAVPQLERALALQDDYLPAVLRLGRARLELGETEQARQLFERALELNPEAPAAHEGLGRIAEAGGDIRQAIRSFERALELEDSATSLHYALGQAYRRLGDLDQARYHLERSGDVTVRVPDPLLNPLANLGQSAQFFLLQAADAMESEDFEVAVAAYERALDQDETSLEAHRGLAFALGRLGDRPGAIAQLESAVTAASGNLETPRQRREMAGILDTLGTLLAAEGDDEAAIRRFRGALKIEAGPGLRLKLGNALARRGRLEDAAEQFTSLLEEEPELGAVVLEKRATVYVNLERRERAIADFERALEIAPEDARLRQRFAEALVFLGDPQRALAEQAIAQDQAAQRGGEAQLLGDRARRLLLDGRPADAVVLLREAVAQAPQDVPLRHQYAALLGQLGRFDESLAQLDEVLRLQPSHGAAHRGRVAALLLTNRYGEARVALQAALKNAPRDAELAQTQVRLLASSPDARVRDGRLALAIARRLADELSDLPTREALALALAELGRFQEAADLQRTVVEEASAAGNPQVLSLVQARQRAFEDGRAWTATSGAEILAGSG